MDLETANPGFLQKYKFTLISLFIILLAAIPLLLLSNTASPKRVATTMQPTMQPSPTTTPLTPANADSNLSQEDQSIQQQLNQVDADIQAANSIDGSQDSTTGL